MKRRISALILALMLAVILIAAAPSAAADAPEVIRAKADMLQLWTDYLYYRQLHSMANTWAYSYIETFLNSREWTDLSRARSVCIGAVEYLKGLEERAKSLTMLSDEDIAALNSAEIDNSYIAVEIENYLWVLEQDRQILESNYRVRLENLDEMSSSDLEIFGSQVKLKRSMQKLTNESLCNQTNYLLAGLNRPEIAQEYWDALPEVYPAIFSERCEWLDNDDLIYAEASRISKEWDKLEDENAKITAAQTAQELKPNAPAQEFPVKNPPQLLPSPSWYNSARTIIYNFYEQEDGTYSPLELNAEPPQKPVSVSMYIGNVGEADYAAYIEQLREQGFAPYRVNNEWVVSFPDYYVIIEYDAGTVSIQFIDEDITFAPQWAIQAK